MKSLKLNKISKEEQKLITGGRYFGTSGPGGYCCCGCACRYADTGGSSTEGNGWANHARRLTSYGMQVVN